MKDIKPKLSSSRVSTHTQWRYEVNEKLLTKERKVKKPDGRSYNNAFTICYYNLVNGPHFWGLIEKLGNFKDDIEWFVIIPKDWSWQGVKFEVFSVRITHLLLKHQANKWLNYKKVVLLCTYKSVNDYSLFGSPSFWAVDRSRQVSLSWVGALYLVTSSVW